MGQKTNPIGNRLGIIRGWDSAWYGGTNFGDKLAEDSKIRKYVAARLSKASVSKVTHRADAEARYYHYLHCPTWYYYRKRRL